MTEPSSKPNEYGKAALSPTVLLGAIITIILFGISAVTYLVAVGREPDQVVGLLTAVGAPAIVSLIALMRIDVVKRQTNGAMTAMHDRMSELEDKVPAAVNDPSAEMRNPNGEQTF